MLKIGDFLTLRIIGPDGVALRTYAPNAEKVSALQTAASLQEKTGRSQSRCSVHTDEHAVLTRMIHMIFPHDLIGAVEIEKTASVFVFQLISIFRV